MPAERRDADAPAGTSEAGMGDRARRGEPDVFECRLCGKVFESRRRSPVCPECDSLNVERMS